MCARVRVRVRVHDHTLARLHAPRCYRIATRARAQACTLSRAHTEGDTHARTHARTHAHLRWGLAAAAILVARLAAQTLVARPLRRGYPACVCAWASREAISPHAAARASTLRHAASGHTCRPFHTGRPHTHAPLNGRNCGGSRGGCLRSGATASSRSDTLYLLRQMSGRMACRSCSVRARA